MAKNDKGKSKGVAFAKRAKISKAQQMMLMAIGGTALVFGITVVGVIYLVKVIRFNIVIIDAKDESIAGFVRVQNNLKNISSKIGALASSEKLESVANKREDEECKEFRNQGFEYGLSTINTARTCSALRVIPDTLPSSVNQEATTSSLNWLINISEAHLEGISYRKTSSLRFKQATDSKGNVDVANTITATPIELSFEVQDSSTKIMNMLDVVEKSIRNYDVYSITMEWSEGHIKINGSYTTYYSAPKTIEIKTKQVCASKESKKCTTGKKSK